MTKIVDPDQLNQATEIVYDRDAKTISLLIAGNLNDTAPGRTSGVTGQAVYSVSKEFWLSDATLNVLRFPFDPIFEQKLILANGWKWLNAQTRDLLRDVGWQEIDGAEYLGFQSLGNFDAVGDQGYYQQIAGFDATADGSVANFDKAGDVNEAVLFLGPGGTPDFSGFLKTHLREQGKLYSEGELVADQALAALDFRFYGSPLENEPDIGQGDGPLESDANIDANPPYTSMSLDYLLGAGFTTWANSTVYAAFDVVLDPIRQSGGSSNGTWWFTLAGGTSSGTGTSDDVGVTWESFVGEEQIGTEWFAFNRILGGNSGDLKEIYEWGQRQNRKTTDINGDALGSPNQDGAGAQFGRIAKLLSNFVGTVLHSDPGVAIRAFDTNFTNDIRLHDITVDGGGLDADGIPVTSTIRSFPFVAAGNIGFSQNLVDEADIDTLFRMYFEYIDRFTDTDVAMTAPSGNTGTITSTNIDLSVWAAGEFMFVAGFANPENNGYYIATGTPAANSIDVTKVDSDDTLIAEALGPTVSLDTQPYDTPDAIIVDNNAGTDITGTITSASIAFDFDYTNNVQGGRTANVDADIVIAAQGIPGARWIAQKFTIIAATGLTFGVAAADELVYSNPP